ncbi:NAD-dependent epimerase/dehydratase family protein [Pseudofrankia sp. BMG5.37]|uniref:NAD-dependent epimerase/dehydratase family protein n=1 Tax=Pseudofrankia sp. BMG5.37 TaxID=3050035 RepID=UPI0028938BED|nr:NAD-dependent epimerase/dehydratase family protein [Pseudofrankia sp. BMG5.37]MDT3438081.1 NAD-dependent epimerase/dehydratase family protein [Pseudofrankia sp. BMG5.37]
MGGRRRVFLTGATGNWGRCVLREFADRADRFDVVALVLPTRREREVIGEFAGMPNLRVAWGDLTDYGAVERCVRGSDHVLHLGAVVSPLADDHPELTRRVNVGGVQNIVRAVLAQEDPTAIGVVMVGSVAETGDRNPPHHWGRVGDPLRVSRFDEYGQSKIIAERVLIESRLPRWVWLRQTGIFHPGVLEIRDAIVTHVPFAGVMEWASAEDSARLVANICEDGVPERFWSRVYNIGGGEPWRLTNWDLQVGLAGALGVKDFRRWYERSWFATRNFHGHWYTDSDDLENLVPFRRDTFDGALARALGAAPCTVRLAGKVPAAIVKNFVIGPLTRQPRGTMTWIRDNDEARIQAYFGSRADWDAIGDWSTFQPPAPDRTPRLLDHGYDETKDPAAWNRADLAAAADFRGGELLSRTVTTGDLATPLRWRCVDGHEFAGSPRLILTAGHWCPECVKDPAGYPRQAAANRFLAQIESTS